MLVFLRPYYLFLVKAAGIALAILLVLFKVRQGGKQAVRNENMQETLEGVQIRDKIENNVISADDVERKRLRKKWQRD